MKHNSETKCASALISFLHPDTNQNKSMHSKLESFEEQIQGITCKDQVIPSQPNNYDPIGLMQEAKQERANNEGLVINEDEHESTSAQSVALKRRLFLVAGDGDSGAPPGKCLRLAARGRETPRERLRRSVFAVLFIIRVSKGTFYKPSSLAGWRLRRSIFAVLFIIRVSKGAFYELSSRAWRQRRSIFAIQVSKGTFYEPSLLARWRLRRSIFAVLFIIRVSRRSKGAFYEPYNILQIRRVVREEVRMGLDPIFKVYSLILSKLESLEERLQNITHGAQITPSQGSSETRRVTRAGGRKKA
ncbi:hypothetical protein ACQ4PT_035897 [Festuca glaucescens]